MARLTRATQKIFAGSATNNGVFGSLQAGSGQLSNDVETIQSLDAYEEGWNSATISSELLPPLEEFQGVQYANSYQQAYTFQEGIPEWDAGTTYYSGSTCKVISGSDFILYKSLIDNNINNTPSSSPSQWAEIFNTANGVQSLSNLSQTLNNSAVQYPSCAAVTALSSSFANTNLDNVTESGKEFISTQGKPSDRYDELTLSETGSTYTAPDNGYFVVQKYVGINGPSFMNLINTVNGLTDEYASYNSPTLSAKVNLSVKKGDVIQCNYNITGTTVYFRFIYDEGVA